MGAMWDALTVVARWLSPLLVVVGFVLAVLLVAWLVGVFGIDGSDGTGCAYGSPGCDDPSWQNYPPFY